MTGQLIGKHIALGVSGSIAAYKAAYVLRRLTERGAQVTPILTQGATRFVAPMTFSALAGRRAIGDLWSHALAGEVGHVEVAHAVHLILVAPASANTLARLAEGHANDPLTAIALASSAPLLIAPAMEDNMWHHKATQEHVAKLQSRGATFVLPSAGALASGRIGIGRLAEPDDIVAAALCLLSPQDLAGKHVLVSAGPTREAFDPARFVSNASTGKMGYALASVAAQRGAKVTLVSGPTALATPFGVERVDVTTTQDMLEACQAALPSAHAIVMAAAPADYRPSHNTPQKLKKEAAQDTLNISLVRTPDILRTLNARALGKVAIGFAAESHDLDVHAQHKLVAKDLDMIVGNDITQPGAGFAKDTNAVVIFSRDGRKQSLPVMSKEDVARAIVDQLASLLS